MNLLLRGAAIAAVLHITPVVVLVKRPDAVQTLLPGADSYVAREVHLSDPDAHRLHGLVDWSPDDGVLTFYRGKAGGTDVGALTFARVDTPHGPIEVAVGFTPQGAVRGVVVTKATVEMKPWVPAWSSATGGSNRAMCLRAPPPSRSTRGSSRCMSREKWTKGSPGLLRRTEPSTIM